MRSIHGLSVALALGVLGCGGAQEASYSDAVTADPDRYTTEFENDAVRLLRVNYGPGEQSVMHRHPFHCAVALNDASWRMHDTHGEAMDLATPMGELVCVEEGVHMPENTGTAAAEVVLVEMKGGMPGAWTSDQPDAVTADPARYAVEYETDAVRVVRVNYGPGETSVLHNHPAYCFVALGDGNWQMTDADGVSTELPTTHGQLACADAQVHSPRNIAATAGQAILIEFKGRETAGGM